MLVCSGCPRIPCSCGSSTQNVVRCVLTNMMRAWVVSDPRPVNQSPLTLVERPVPIPARGEVLVRVRVCGVCRTDLHLAEGELAPRRSEVVPGHEVIGEVVHLGEGADRFQTGDRVGIAWLRHTCGACRWCRSGKENLCPKSRYTGWDADGGYAEFAVVPEVFAYRIPTSFADEQAAPLLCAGIIGYRSLLRAQLPPGARRGVGGWTVGPVTSAPRLGYHLRAGRRAGAAGTGVPGPWWDAGTGRNPYERHSGAGLPAPSFRGAHRLQCGGQHPPCRPGV